MEIESAVLNNLPAPGDFAWSFGKLFDSIKQVSDVQVVHDGSGRGTVGMIEKLLNAVGCPSWTDLAKPG